MLDGKKGYGPNLEKLILKGCKNLKDEGLKISGSKLRVLDLSDTDITGIGLEEGDYCLTSLETLNLANCQELTDGGLVKILRISGSKLIVLTLADTNITGMGLEKEVKALPMLENLKLSFCCNLTNEGLVEILRISGNKLRVLNLFGNRITGLALEET